MRSIAFPKIFNDTGVVTNLVYDHDATLQNLKMLLWSEKGELFGDPYYGTALKRYLYDQNDSVLKDILIDEIYTAVRVFMPQIIIERKDVKINRTDKGEISCTIKAINRLDFTTDLYTIVLLQAEA